MDYCPPPAPPISELVFNVCSYTQNDEQDLHDMYEEYKRLIHPLNQAIFTIMVELRNYPDEEYTLDMISFLCAVREETIEFFGLQQCDRGMMSKGPWPPRENLGH